MAQNTASIVLKVLKAILKRPLPINPFKFEQKTFKIQIQFLQTRIYK